MLDIVIVNWNSGQLLNDAVNSILKSSYSNYKIFIVDNNSMDSSLDNLANDSRINTILNEDNMGFGYACNQAISLSCSNYVLLLNPDTKVFSETLHDSISFMEKNPSISAMGCKHVDIKGKTQTSCTRFPSFLTALYDIIGISKFLPKLFHPSTRMTDWDHETSASVDQVMGAYMLIRRSILNKVGFFDNRFFVYYEDLDLSKRIVDSGGKIFYNTDVEIYHEGGGTSKQVKSKRLFYSLRSKLLYYKKYFGRTKFYILFVLVLSVEFFTRQLQVIVRMDYSSMRGIYKAYKELYKYFLDKRFAK